MSSRSALFSYLEEHGPSTLHDNSLAFSSSVHSNEGIRRFDLPSSSNSCSSGIGAKRKRVYYIAGVHSKKEVLRVYNEVNDDIFRSLPVRSVVTRIPDEFRPVAKEMYELSYDAGTVRCEYGGECPLCEEEYDFTLPKHMRTECEEV